MSDLRKAAERIVEAAEKIDGSNELDNAIEALFQALSQPEQEPVAWILNRELFWPSEYEIISEDGDNAIPLYTAPPKREWVGLTDKEIEEYKWMGQDVIAVIKEVQATLKEKNGG